MVARAAGAADPRPEERGFPLLHSHEPAEYHASPQNFGLTQDPSGLIYVANLHGVLIYDGAWWRRIGCVRAAGVFTVPHRAGSLRHGVTVSDVIVSVPSSRWSALTYHVRFFGRRRPLASISPSRAMSSPSFLASSW